jgi:hypothetical protein
VAAESPARPVPLYRSRPDENYWYEYLEEEKTVYLNYNSCRQMRDRPFEIFAEEFWGFVESNEVEKLVLDIRDNRGGSSTRKMRYGSLVSMVHPSCIFYLAQFYHIKKLCLQEILY